MRDEAQGGDVRSMAGWGLGLGRGPGEGGAAWAPVAAACPAPPAREVSCCNQSPVCVGLELEPEPEQERLGGEGKEAVGWGFFPGGGLAAACSPPLPACLFSLPLPASGFSLCLCLSDCIALSHLV